MTTTFFLDVFLHKTLIGTINYIGSDRSIFSFKENYINDNERPTLSLSFKDASGNISKNIPPTQTRLLPFFSNLLPEGALREYLVSLSKVNPVREFFLLRALGQDLPGALTIIPQGGHDFKDDVKQQKSIDGDFEKELRFSLAGVQLKFSALTEATGGLTIPSFGLGGDWIVKLPSFQFDHVPENEFSMMSLAKKMGMNVPEIKLVDMQSIRNIPKEFMTQNAQAFAIKRFDRESSGTPIHTEDFAQVFGVYPEKKYAEASFKNILQVIASEGEKEDIIEFIKRLIFNALIGNADMHLKNWSLIYRDKRKPSLAPAYDFVSTIPYIPDQKAALNFSRTKRFDQLNIDELKHLAMKSKIPISLVVDAALETVELFHQHWHKEKKHLLLSNDMINLIDRHIETIPLR